MNNNFLEYALKYAALGWHIFPLCPGQKVPFPGTHGVRDATTNEECIKKWWSKWPNANIGLACGEKSGIYVIDVDNKSSNTINGFESLKKFPELPKTVTQLSGDRGAHFLYAAKVPPRNSNFFKPGIEIRCDGFYIVLAPSTHPLGGKYKWADGCSPWEIELAEFPEFMRPLMRVQPPTVSSSLASKGLPLSQPGESADILQRASSYLSQCEPAIQGQSGHDKLLYAANRLIHGFLLSDEQAYDLLVHEYNPNCIPPWDLSNPKDERDFRRKITEARRLPPQRTPGWLITDCTSIDIGKIDVDSLISVVNPQFSTKSCVLIPPTQNELDFLCRPVGLLGEICSWINQTALKKQPFLSLACALTFLGVLFGRKIRDTLGSRTNLYCMGIAPSSAGKAHAMNQIRRLCEASGCSDLLGGSDIASDAAIEDRMSRHPATLFLKDEIGHFLCHIKSGISKHHAQIVSLLMQLYSAAGNIYLGKEYAENDKQRIISQPCCCVYGASTSGRFISSISPEELQDGWLSRCLVFSSSSNPVKNRETFEQPVPQSIVEQVSKWKQREFKIENDGHIVSQFITPSMNPEAPIQLVVPTDKDAESIFINFDSETRKYGETFPLLECLWAKGEENARRVALIIAGGDNFDNPIITASIADYSCRLLRYLLNDFSRVIAPEVVSSTNESYKRKLIAIIGNAGINGIRQGNLSRASQWANRKQREDLISDLVESEEVVRGGVKDGTRTVVYYWTTSNYLEYMKNKQ